jgi:hypothetical protein
VIGNARGDILFRGASGWQVLAPGTSGNVLQTNGAGADPTWVTPSGGGGGGGPASIYDDGTNAYLALVDPSGQLVLDPSGNPVWLPPEVFPVNSIPSASGYVTGPRSAEVVGKVKGITNGSNAAAGDVGEEIKTVVPFVSGASLSNGVAANIGSIVLTPGDWDVSASAGFYASSTSPNSCSFALSTVSATFPSSTADTSGQSEISVSLSTSLANIFPVPPTRFNVTVNTTIYLVVSGAWSGAGSPIGWGTLRARRMR